MQSEINAEGMHAMGSRVLQPSNAHHDRQQADRDTGTPLQVSELVAMVDPGAEVIKVGTAGSPAGYCSPSPRTVRVLHRRRLGTKRDAETPSRSAAPGRGPTLDAKSAGCTGTTPSSLATPTQVDIERSPQFSRRTVRMRPAYERASLCTPSELPLCTVRICVPSTGGAYALALLAIGALGESVSLSGKTKPGR